MVLQNPDRVQHWLLHGLLRTVAGRSSWKRNPPWRNPETIEVYTAVCDNVCWRLADISTHPLWAQEHGTTLPGFLCSCNLAAQPDCPSHRNKEGAQTLVEEEREVVVLHFKVPIEQQRTIVTEDTDVCGINFKDRSSHHHAVLKRNWTITKNTAK